MLTGKIKWFNPTKGYGFIACDNGDKDAFLHISTLQRDNLPTPEEGQKVTFILELNKRTGKTAAANVRMV